MQITTATQNAGFFAGVLVGDPPPDPSTPPNVFVGTANADTFLLPAGFGDASISNFDPANDVVQFGQGAFGDFASLMDHATGVGGNTIITQNAHDVLTIQNVTPGQLHASDFHFT
jgi:hypothetical protein